MNFKIAFLQADHYDQTLGNIYSHFSAMRTHRRLCPLIYRISYFRHSHSCLILWTGSSRPFDDAEWPLPKHVGFYNTTCIWYGNLRDYLSSSQSMQNCTDDKRPVYIHGEAAEYANTLSYARMLCRKQFASRVIWAPKETAKKGDESSHHHNRSSSEHREQIFHRLFLSWSQPRVGKLLSYPRVYEFLHYYDQKQCSRPYFAMPLWTTVVKTRCYPVRTCPGFPPGY